MTFATFDNRPVRDAVKMLAEADKLAVVIGAGVSAEAGLPGWSLLVERLLERASQKVPHFQSEEQRREWVERTMRTELPPGAAGIAQTLLGKELTTALRQELYRPPDSRKALTPDAFFPGPTAHAVAALRVAWDAVRPRSPMKILTTNYDDLLERAFRHRDDIDSKRVIPVYWPQKDARLPPDRIKVHHLHGYFDGSRKARGTVTLTDTSYATTAPAIRTRDAEIHRILSDHSCLFLGTSFADPNIIRYVYRSADQRRARTDELDTSSPAPRHVALFTHHSNDPESVLRVREEIAQARLGEAFTRCVFLDHYADVSQFVYELRNRIVDPDYQQHASRARSLLQPILSTRVFPTNTRRFNLAQPDLNRRLTAILKSAIRSVDRETGSHLVREDVALAVWLLDKAGRRLTPWITTDRVHLGPTLLQSVDVQPGSRWLAVRAVCEGKWLSEPRTPDDSRWAYIAGFPLLLDDGLRGKLCVGAVTLTTQTSGTETWLRRLGREHQLKFKDRLTDDIGSWLVAE